MTTQTQPTADELLARSLASGRTIACSAHAAGVSESTAYRRLREPGFRARVAELRAVLLDAINGQITSETVTACQTLCQLLRSPSEATQLRAAKTVIELALKFNDRDRRAGLFGPDATPPDTPGPPAPEAEPAGRAPGEAATRAPSGRPAPVEPAASPAPARDTQPGNGHSVPPVVTVEAHRETGRNLSKPVTDRHEPTRSTRAGRSPFLPLVKNDSGSEGRPHLDQTDRLSVGLAAALERAGSV